MPFLNIAHRGARAFAPENTISAIRLAQRLGANAVEIDVQMSRDGELVVFHDDEVTAVSDAAHKYPLHRDYAVSAFTWDELQTLDVGAWYVHELARPASRRRGFLRDLRADEVEQWITAADADEYESGTVRIPHLEAALAAARDCGLAVLLDVKTIPRRYPSIAEKTVNLVRTLGLQDETMITSFDHALVAEVRAHDERIATGVLTAERLHDPVAYVLALDADAFQPGCAGEADVVRRGLEPDDVDAETIRRATEAGLMVNVWTENAEPRMRTLIEAGVTGIFTDYPNRLAQIVAAGGRDAPGGLTLRRR